MRKEIILLVVMIMVVLGIWLYLFFTSPVKETETPEVVLPKPAAPPPERHEFEGIEYEIISVGGPVYDIITGEIIEEQVEALAEKIIGDILTQTPGAQVITLLFYSDFITLGAGEVDVAEISWTSEGINIKITE